MALGKDPTINDISAELDKIADSLKNAAYPDLDALDALLADPAILSILNKNTNLMNRFVKLNGEANLKIVDMFHALSTDAYLNETVEQQGNKVVFVPTNPEALTPTSLSKLVSKFVMQDILSQENVERVSERHKRWTHIAHMITTEKHDLNMGISIQSTVNQNRFDLSQIESGKTVTQKENKKISDLFSMDKRFGRLRQYEKFLDHAKQPYIASQNIMKQDIEKANETRVVDQQYVDAVNLKKREFQNVEASEDQKREVKEKLISDTRDLPENENDLDEYFDERISQFNTGRTKINIQPDKSDKQKFEKAQSSENQRRKEVKEATKLDAIFDKQMDILQKQTEKQQKKEAKQRERENRFNIINTKIVADKAKENFSAPFTLKGVSSPEDNISKILKILNNLIKSANIDREIAIGLLETPWLKNSIINDEQRAFADDIRGIGESAKRTIKSFLETDIAPIQEMIDRIKEGNLKPEETPDGVLKKLNKLLDNAREELSELGSEIGSSLLAETENSLLMIENQITELSSLISEGKLFSAESVESASDSFVEFPAGFQFDKLKSILVDFASQIKETLNDFEDLHLKWNAIQEGIRIVSEQNLNDPGLTELIEQANLAHRALQTIEASINLFKQFDEHLQNLNEQSTQEQVESVKLILDMIEDNIQSLSPDVIGENKIMFDNLIENGKQELNNKFAILTPTENIEPQPNIDHVIERGKPVENVLGSLLNSTKQSDYETIQTIAKLSIIDPSERLTHKDTANLNHFIKTLFEKTSQNPYQDTVKDNWIALRSVLKTNPAFSSTFKIFEEYHATFLYKNIKHARNPVEKSNAYQALSTWMQENQAENQKLFQSERSKLEPNVIPQVFEWCEAAAKKFLKAKSQYESQTAYAEFQSQYERLWKYIKSAAEPEKFNRIMSDATALNIKVEQKAHPKDYSPKEIETAWMAYQFSRDKHGDNKVITKQLYIDLKNKVEHPSADAKENPKIYGDKGILSQLNEIRETLYKDWAETKGEKAPEFKPIQPR